MESLVIVIDIQDSFLILPSNFDNDQYRANKSFLAIFSVALLTAGFSLTGFLCFAVRNWLFRADAVLLPALSSCALGLLTVFYCFLINNRYAWNTAALLTTIAASISTIVYAGLLIWTQRRLSAVKATAPASIPLRRTSFSSNIPLYQDPTYYSNYLANMYPASTNGGPTGPPAEALTEEELQRQQMLMLLLNRPLERAPSLNQTADSFNRIEWETREEGLGSPLNQRGERAPPYNGYYAPQPQHPPAPAYTPQYTPQGIAPPMRIGEQELRPWDGVWRGGEVPSQERLHPAFRDARTIGRSPSREARRRQIENGLG